MYALRWSPNGSHLIFNYGQRNEIHQIDAVGSNQHILIEAGRAPLWSPDGSKIVFICQPSGSEDSSPASLCVGNADGTNQHPIANDVESNFYSRGLPQNYGWGPDSKSVVFSSDRPDIQSEIVMQALDGSNRRTIGFGDNPQFSPDAKYLLFTTQGKAGETLTISNADGSNRRWLSEIGIDTNEQPILWSPDSQHIAFVSSRGPAMQPIWEIYVAAVDGSDVHALIPNGYTISPAWSPDSKRLAYLDITDDPTNLSVTDVDGKNTHKI